MLAVLIKSTLIVLMGGLISSTFLARVVTPVLYKLLALEVEQEATPPLIPAHA